MMIPSGRSLRELRYNRALFWAFCTREFLLAHFLIKTRGLVAFFLPFPSILPSPSLPPRASASQSCLTRPSPRHTTTTQRSTRSTKAPASQRQAPRARPSLNAGGVGPRAVRTRKPFRLKPRQPQQARPLRKLPADPEEGPRRGLKKRSRRPRAGSPPSLPLSESAVVPAKIPYRNHRERTGESQAPLATRLPQRRSGDALPRTPVERSQPLPSPSRTPVHIAATARTRSYSIHAASPSSESFFV
ncbi:hypothetical protein PYCCODRAFT_880673 [Trametes coccinea BRFM310]|uniref:Uncharacterized protein n=1 Tax=Trametes coccinea (strain BRFM310) TaxID=1353009 RepID=A0A1Y2ID01_TRAC3|nr:hypothetical protein PYCCODRAFT_880673 [Trametes coccinea BRFM310]